MRVWRITGAAHAANPLSGEGAARSGSRWNSPGIRIGYTSVYRSLAVLEMLVHVTRDTVPDHLVLIPVDVPDTLISKISILPDQERQTGDEWVRSGTSLGLLVPSFVLRGEFNLLINPLHPEFRRVKVAGIERDFLDPRFFGGYVSETQPLRSSPMP